MSEIPQDPLALLTPDQVCELWGVKKDYLYDQVQQGFIPAVRLRRTLRFRRQDLVAFLEQQISQA